MRRFVLAALLCLIASVAWANNPFVGYYYPAKSTPCSPLCTSISATLTIPTVTDSGDGGDELVVGWIGISGSGGSLGQIGFQITPIGGNAGCLLFYENYGGSVDNTPRVLSNGCQAGDKVFVSITCTSNCGSLNASQTWDLVLNDITQNLNFTMTGKPYELAMTIAQVLIEIQASHGTGNFAAQIDQFAVCTTGAANCTPTLTTLTSAMCVCTPQENFNGNPAIADRYTIAGAPFGAGPGDGAAVAGSSFLVSGGFTTSRAAYAGAISLPSPRGTAGAGLGP